jgi:hypothetical protein
MPGQPLCADSLVLMGEVLRVAAQYIEQCEENVDTEEDPRMVALACDQVLPLITQIENLRKQVVALEARLVKKLPQQREPIAERASRRMSKA